MWFFVALLVSSALVVRSTVWAQPVQTIVPSVTATTTPSPGATPTPQQISDTKTVFGAIGFLFGFFLTYSITSGTKTQDVFKSFLGVAGLGSGLLETKVFPLGVQLDGLTAYGAGAFRGFVVYLVIAFVLSTIYAATYVGADTSNILPPEKTFSLFASALARAVLGEELRPPAATLPKSP